MTAILVTAAQWLDGLTFSLAASTGISGELNPLGPVFHAVGWGGVLFAKSLALAAILPILRRLHGRWWLLPAWTGTLGAATNVWALV